MAPQTLRSCRTARLDGAAEAWFLSHARSFHLVPMTSRMICIATYMCGRLVLSYGILVLRPEGMLADPAKARSDSTSVGCVEFGVCPSLTRPGVRQWRQSMSMRRAS